MIFLRIEYATAFNQLDSSSSSLKRNETPDSIFSPLIRFFLDPSSTTEVIRFKRLFLVILGLNVFALKLEGYGTVTKSNDHLCDCVRTLEFQISQYKLYLCLKKVQTQSVNH